MSAINIIVRGGEAHILTDGALIALDGTVSGLVEKQFLFPTFPAVLSCGGSFVVALAVAGRLRQQLISDFDGMVETIHSARMWAVDLLAPTLAAHKLGGSAELYATGWSRRRDAIESWVIPFCGLDDRAELKMVDDPLGCMNPQPSQEAIESVGWCVPTGDSFDPLKDGLMLMEAQRRTPVDRGPLSVERDASQMVYGVGGFIQHTVITRLSIRSSVIHRWADEIGKAIDPVCSARSMRAAERTSRYSC